MDWPTIAQSLFYVMATAIAAYGVHVLSKLQSSVEELNIKIAVVVARLEYHEERLTRLERE